MKLSKEEQSFIDTIKHTWRENIPSQKEIDYLFDVLNKLVRPQSRDRFTYEMRKCGECFGGPASSDCDSCGGLGKIKTKVKRTAHSVQSMNCVRCGKRFFSTFEGWFYNGQILCLSCANPPILQTDNTNYECIKGKESTTDL